MSLSSVVLLNQAGVERLGFAIKCLARGTVRKEIGIKT